LHFPTVAFILLRLSRQLPRAQLGFQAARTGQLVRRQVGAFRLLYGTHVQYKHVNYTLSKEPGPFDLFIITILTTCLSDVANLGAHPRIKINEKA
jgi:hypothetical protein